LGVRIGRAEAGPNLTLLTVAATPRRELELDLELGRARSEWISELTWKALAETEARSFSGPVLLLTDDRVQAAALTSILQRRDVACAQACRGPTYAHGEGDVFSVDPASAEDLRRLLAAKPWRAVIHAWGVGAAEISVEAHAGSWLALLKAVLETGADVELYLATEGALPVANTPPVAPLQSAAWGMARCAAIEHAGLLLRCIDLDPSDPLRIAAVARELFLTAEGEVGVRADTRYAPRLRRRNDLALEVPRLDADAAYLVSGGGGGLGREVVRTLVEQGARTVIVAGRSGPPGAWRETRDEAGIRVIRATCDVSDPAQVDQLFARLGRGPPLRGIIHAAGVLDDGALQNLDAERLQRVLGPKVAGFLNLARAATDSPLDFFVLFSSAAGVLGSPGQANYGAANACLDALAARGRAVGLPTTSLAWGAWAGETRASGARTERALVDTGILQRIPMDVGRRLFAGLLRGTPAGLLVTPFSASAFLAVAPHLSGRGLFAEHGRVSASAIGRTRQPRPMLATPFRAPATPVEETIASAWADALGLLEVGIDDELFELGGDSVVASQILAVVARTFGVRPDAEQAYQAFTVSTISALVEAALMEKVEGLSDEAVAQMLAALEPEAAVA
jgi:myxalamid-type polyketide synthase MxaE and MxaD